MATTFQIIGTRKCAATRKAQRYFKDRGIDYHFVDLLERPLSPGELRSISSAAKGSDLIDESSPEFEKRGLKYMDYDPLEELAAHPLLLRTPLVRGMGELVIGDDEAGWARVAGAVKGRPAGEGRA